MQDYKAEAQAIGALTRARRKKLGLTQTELADLAGVSAKFVYDLENGKPTIAFDRFLLVKSALGLTLTLQVINNA